MVCGPKRSGKGTIARVLTALLGPVNVAGPPLGSLATNFGLQPLMGNLLAIVSDARLSGRTDQAIVVERLLSISGEDSLTIDRKHKSPVTVKLPTRFMLLTNELPRLRGTCGALASRFIILTLTESWFGREDHDLTDELLAELPSILLWALDGWAELQKQGHFTQPGSSADAIRELEDLSSPMGAFLRDRCETGTGCLIDRDELFGAWKSWCEEQGRDRPGTKATFGRDLRAAVPTLRESRPWAGGSQSRSRRYEGVTLRDEGSSSPGNFGANPPYDPENERSPGSPSK